jgi:hypothetical protein
MLLISITPPRTYTKLDGKKLQEGINHYFGASHVFQTLLTVYNYESFTMAIVIRRALANRETLFAQCAVGAGFAEAVMNCEVGNRDPSSATNRSMLCDRMARPVHFVCLFLTGSGTITGIHERLRSHPSRAIARRVGTTRSPCTGSRCSGGGVLRGVCSWLWTRSGLAARRWQVPASISGISSAR